MKCNRIEAKESKSTGPDLPAPKTNLFLLCLCESLSRSKSNVNKFSARISMLIIKLRSYQSYYAGVTSETTLLAIVFTITCVSVNASAKQNVKYEAEIGALADEIPELNCCYLFTKRCLPFVVGESLLDSQNETRRLVFHITCAPADSSL